MTGPKEQMKFRSKEETFSEWGIVFLAIVVTAALVGIVGGLLASKNLEEKREKESEAFRIRQENGPSIFKDIMNQAEESELE